MDLAVTDNILVLKQLGIEKFRRSKFCQMTEIVVFLALGFVGFIWQGCMAKATLEASEKVELPIAEFDPENEIVPFPNDLARNDDTGLVDLPRQCVEPEAAYKLRRALNKLSGFGTFQPRLRATFSEAVSEDSLEGRVWVFCRQVGQTIYDPQDVSQPELSFEAHTEETTRFDSDCYGILDEQALNIELDDPLPQNSICTVALLDGILTLQGESFLPAPVWYLVRQTEAPVVLNESDGEVRVVTNRTPIDASSPIGRERLKDLEKLWRDHRPALEFLSAAIAARRDGPGSPPLASDEILLAWEFTTQATTSSFEPQNPEGVIAQLGLTPDNLNEVLDVAMGLEAVRDKYTEVWELNGGEHPCDEILPCADVGSIVEASYLSPNFQSEAENPAGLEEKVTGEWDDPQWPKVNAQKPFNTIRFYAFVPDSSRHPMPAAGYPTVIWGHGLFGSIDSMFNLGPVFAAAGFLSVSAEWVNHGDRGVKVNDSIGCEDVEEYDDDPYCYEHIIPSELAVGRDNVRQSVFDALKLIRVLKACSGGACFDLPVDPNRIGYAGQSVGSILGTLIAATSSDIKAAVLNVGGAGWVNVFIDSGHAVIRCPVVDNLIRAGVLQGQTWDGGANPSPLCMQEYWKDDPTFKLFASMAQWALDPADPVNYAPLLKARMLEGSVHVLVQEVEWDNVVPNHTTEKQARLLGLGTDTDGDAEPDPIVAMRAEEKNPPPTPAAISGNNEWILYRYVDPRPPGFLGNSYTHTSIYWSPDGSLAGWLGTWRIQADAIAFLLTHL